MMIKELAGEKEIFKINKNLTPFTAKDLGTVFGRLSDRRVKDQIIFFHAHPLRFYVNGLFAARTSLLQVLVRIKHVTPETIKNVCSLKMQGCNGCGSTSLHHMYGIAVDIELSHVPVPCDMHKMIRYFNENGWYFMETEIPNTFHFEATWEALEVWRRDGLYAI